LLSQLFLSVSSKIYVIWHMFNNLIANDDVKVVLREFALGVLEGRLDHARQTLSCHARGRGRLDTPGFLDAAQVADKAAFAAAAFKDPAAPGWDEGHHLLAFVGIVISWA
jgi:hypothetical protein